MIPVGVSDQSIIPDSQITASSKYSSTHKPAYGRLDDRRGDGWCSATSNSTFDWLQVDLGKATQICAVATQGDVEGKEWVIDFKLSFSNDEKKWTTYKNAEGAEVVRISNYCSNGFDEL